jgi:argininosuccinate synthase
LSNPIVLAYSGSADTSAAIASLRASHAAEVIAVTMDLGQGGDLEAVRDRALALGAVRAHVLDLRDQFARDFVVPALKADALYEDRYPLETALAWPLIALKLDEVAGIEQTRTVAHGGRTHNGEPSPLSVSIRGWNPTMTVISAPRVAAAGASPPANANLWGRSIEAAAIEDPWREPPEDLYTLTKAGTDCPGEPAYVELSFEQGIPVAINGITMPLVDLIASLSTIAGAHGVGRLDLVDHRSAGRSRKIYEAPAAVVLHTAHKELTKLVAGRDLDRFGRHVRVHYADLVCHGLWFTRLREALDAFVDNVQQQVTGDVRLRLFKGACRTVGRKSGHGGPQSTVDGRRSTVALLTRD